MKKYGEEFKREAVRKVLDGRSVAVKAIATALLVKQFIDLIVL